MNNAVLPVIALALTTATSAGAEGVEYLRTDLSVTGFSSDDLGDADLQTGNIGFEFRKGQFLFNGDIISQNLSTDTFDERTTFASGTIGYFVAPNVALIGSVIHGDQDNDSFTVYQIGGEYNYGSYTVGAHYRDVKDSDATAVSAYASYQTSEGIEAGMFLFNLDGHIAASIGLTYDQGPFDVTMLVSEFDGLTDFHGVGRYDFGNGVRAITSFSNMEDDLTEVSLGAGYEVTDNVWIDASLVRLNLDGAGGVAKGITIGINYEMGAEALLVDRITTMSTEARSSLLNRLN